MQQKQTLTRLNHHQN